MRIQTNGIGSACGDQHATFFRCSGRLRCSSYDHLYRYLHGFLDLHGHIYRNGFFHSDCLRSRCGSRATPTPETVTVKETVPVNVTVQVKETVQVPVQVVVTATPQPTAAPKKGGVLIAARAADAIGLDPHKQTAFSSFRVMELIYDTLVTLDKNMNIVPSMAESWSYGSDGKTLM